MHNHYKKYARHLAHTGMALVLTLGLATAAAGADPAALSLAQSPLFIGTTATPNVMVAIDNSGTMDLETLFPTDSGMLYWDTHEWHGAVPEILNGVLSTAKGGESSYNPEGYNTPSTASSDQKLQPYGYLFPNGCNDGQPPGGRRVYCKIDTSNSGLLGATINGLLGIPSPLTEPNVNLFQTLFGEKLNDDGQLTIGALPPVPQFAFARSPDYNKMYFDPNVDYESWPGKPNAVPTAASSDPIVGGPTVNLTATVDNLNNPNQQSGGWRFRVDKGMIIPNGTEISFGPLLNLFNGGGLEPVDNLLNGVISGVGGLLGGVTSLVCGVLKVVPIIKCPDVLNQVLGILGGWKTVHSNDSNGWVVGEPLTKDLLGLPSCEFSGLIGRTLGKLGGIALCNGAVTNLLNNVLLPLDIYIKYYPATFYLKLTDATADSLITACNSLLPSGYLDQTTLLTKADDTPDLGDDPSGNPVMCGFKIKPDARSSAMQNFANWFTYYRKRQLAVRGGLETALEENDGTLNVGVTATNPASNNAKPIDMHSTSPGTGLNALYDDINNLDFYAPLGAPNRSALAYLGDQFGRSSDPDSEPVITRSCQQNNAMLFTDGYNTDGQNAISVDPGDNNQNMIFADNESNTIADVAMHYYLDLAKPDGIADGEVPVSDACDAVDPPLRLDCNKNPHMVTSAVTLDQRGHIYNNPTTPDPYNEDSPVNWNSVAAQQAGLSQIDDLWHATVNSRGQMLNAQTPAGIADAFKKALKQSAVARGSATGVATQSRNLNTNTNHKAFLASFTSGDWHGELTARTVDNQTAQLSDNPNWTAAAQLTARRPGSRTILTTNALGNAKAFTVDATSLGLDNKLIRYIRGNRSNEQVNGRSFRNRGNDILGDIVHSTPLYVGTPGFLRYPVDWDDFLQDGNQKTPEDNAGSYRDFVSKQAGRTPMVYVGANDGMLHGFDADTGAEKLGYVPNAVFGNLAQLTAPNYSHHYYVDGDPGSGDVVFGGQWHTVLVGGLRGGGKSVYALDVTDPADFSESQPGKTALWEYKNDDLGYVYGKPSIVRLHDGKWAALFGNGYDSTHRTTALFVIDIGTGDCIAKLSAYSGSTSCTDQAGNAPYGKPHGLSEPFPVDLDGDFITDYAYAGDLNGNLWRFDLTNSDPSQWSAETVFTATDNEGNPQPITSQPQVGAHPYGLDYGVMVYFGTGKYLETGDRTSTPDNTFYGIWDPRVSSTVQQQHGAPTFAPAFAGVTEATRDDLVTQSVITAKGVNGNTYRGITDAPVDYQPDNTENSDAPSTNSYDRGWLLSLPGTGERVVSNAELQEGNRGENNTVAFSTLLPGDPEACGAAGNGFFMVLDQLNGGRTQTPVFDLNGDLQFTNADKKFTDKGGDDIGASGQKLGAGIPNASTHQSNQGSGKAYYIVPTSNGKTTTIPIPLLGRNGRVSWREIRQ